MGTIAVVTIAVVTIAVVVTMVIFFPNLQQYLIL